MKKLPAFFLFLILTASALFVALPLPGTIPVLMYHYIGTEKESAIEGNFVSRENFAKQMAFLHRFGYRIISLDDYYAIKTGQVKPRGREIVITFDDGDKSLETEALPILEPYHFPITIFLISDRVPDGKFGTIPLATIKELQKRDWISFEAHTKTHPFLSKIPAEQLEAELRDSKKELETMLQKPFHYLAYPFGDFDQRVKEVAQKNGYRLAFTTAHKRLAGSPEDFFALTRIKINRVSDHPIVFWYHISGLHQWIKSFREYTVTKYGF